MPDLILSDQQPWYSKKLSQCESIVVSNIEELPFEAAAEKEYCYQQGIKSLALIPLVVSDSFLGLVGFSAFNSEREWPDAVVRRLWLEIQVKLLRVLQSGKFERLGGEKTITYDVRIIAATNRDLIQSVNSGQFCMDLYYRLNVFPIVVLPLRSRSEDIPQLTRFFCERVLRKDGKTY